jgi:Mor family transcriptional regulator|tara:strand:+ start:317 stop:538 length:222 start_codon:yes stop_codon:yes gene_type:complete
LSKTGNSELYYDRMADHINNEEDYLTQNLHANRRKRTLVINNMIKDGYSVIQIAKKFDVSRQRIYKIIKAKND